MTKRLAILRQCDVCHCQKVARNQSAADRQICKNAKKMSNVWRWWVCGAACAALAVAGIRLRMRRVWGRAAPGAPNSMRGKTVLITGAASGLGLAAATELVSRGARIILACRDLDKGRSVVTDIRKRYPSGGELVCGYDFKCIRLGSIWLI